MVVREKRNATFAEAVILLLSFVGIMSWGAMVGKIPTGMSVLLCGILTATYGMLVLHFTWDEIQSNILKLLGIGMPAILILLMVGLITASWLASGTTPIIIYWGLKIINPSVFLVSAFLLTAMASMATGSSWAIVGTFGVALLGIAQGLGIPVGIAAGAIVAGSFLGDKWSPLSDSANLAAAITGTNIIKLVTIMIPTSGVAAVAAAILYGLVGIFLHSSGSIDTSILNTIMGGLAKTYHFNLWLLLPPAVVIYLAIKKKPILPVLIIGVALGTILAIIVQGVPVDKMLNILYNGNKAATGVASIDKLLSGGGLASMMSLVLILFCAFTFAGAVECIGILDALLNKLKAITSSPGSLVLTSLVTSILTVYLSSSVYVSMILNGRMYGPPYEKAGLEKANLSRSILEAACYSGAYVPWSGGALVIMGSLGVSWNEYMPYIFSHWIAVVLVVIYAFLGKFTEKNVPLEEAPEASLATIPEAVADLT